MEKIIIVGSGASAVHFALSVLRKGYQVLMLDIGRLQPEIVNPADTFNELKKNLSDPAEYFLGRDFEAVIYPDYDGEYYGFPPSKNHVLKGVDSFKYHSNGFKPLSSFAQGGLAEVWTAGVYPLRDQDLLDFPLSYSDFKPYYSQVADRIGITGTRDDLDRFYPYHRNLMPPLELDQHSEILLSEYGKRRGYINDELGSYIGRSRVATLSRDKEQRKACTYTGRCLWGCPAQSLYTPSITLHECKKYPNFTYKSNLYVTHFVCNAKRHINNVFVRSTNENKVYEFELDKLVLAAGTLSSSKIVMNSIYNNTGEIIKLRGLMDNRQLLIPFINTRMIGKQYNPGTYQYHQLALGIDNENPRNYIHGQITTLKTALIHPIVQKIPLDLKSATFVFRNLHAALGVVNVNFPQIRREENYLSLKTERNSSWPSLLINYVPPPNERNLIRFAIKKVKKVFAALGCFVPPGMIHVRPMGASVHYSGTIPMSSTEGPYTVSKHCQSHDFRNLYVVDGSVFPFLPAKNLTFTLMANAIRVAETAF
jgi:choline dehydrogenase-like flavoprotein